MMIINLWAEPKPENFFLTHWKTGQNGKNGQKRAQVSFADLSSLTNCPMFQGENEE